MGEMDEPLGAMPRKKLPINTDVRADKACGRVGMSPRALHMTYTLGPHSASSTGSTAVSQTMDNTADFTTG